MLIATLITGCSHHPDRSSTAVWQPGETVTVRGRITDKPWQHMMIGVEGKVHELLDLDDGERQIVVYWTAPPVCSGWIEVTGVVIEAKGPLKRPKPGKEYRALQLDVTAQRCVD